MFSSLAIIFAFITCVKGGFASYILVFFIWNYLVFIIICGYIIVDYCWKNENYICVAREVVRVKLPSYFAKCLFYEGFERGIKAMIIPIFVADFKIWVDFGLVTAALLFLIICFVVILLVHYFELLFQIFIKLVVINQKMDLFLKKSFILVKHYLFLLKIYLAPRLLLFLLVWVVY